MKGCKQCPARAKCTTVTYRGSACDALRWTYGLDEDPEIVTDADVVDVVRCSDCKYSMPIGSNEIRCEYHDFTVWPENGFCSYGERKVRKNNC